MKLELVGHADPILRSRAEAFDFEDPQVDPGELAAEMQRLLKLYGGLGLAAPQVGLGLRVFAMSTPDAAIVFNPRTVDVSEETVSLEEGCLSFPGLFAKVERPRHVKVRFQLANGETRTLKLTGMTARIWQHESDHLDGVMFFDGASRLRREKMIRTAAKLGVRYTHADLRRTTNDE